MRFTTPFSRPPVSKRYTTCAMRGRTSVCTVDSAEVARQHRTDGIDEAARHPAPQVDGAAIARIRRIVLRHRGALEEVILVVEGCRLEAPVLLEIERAGLALRTAEIEDAQTAFASAPHQLPV